MTAVLEGKLNMFVRESFRVVFYHQGVTNCYNFFDLFFDDLPNEIIAIITEGLNTSTFG